MCRVLPYAGGFCRYWLDKAAFLHASDIMPHTECGGDEQNSLPCAISPTGVRTDLMVQVGEDPLGTKGARLTTDITRCPPVTFVYARRHTLAFPSASKAKVNASAPEKGGGGILRRTGRVLLSVPRRKACVKSDLAARRRQYSSAFGRKSWSAKASGKRATRCMANWRRRSACRDFADAQS